MSRDILTEIIYAHRCRSTHHYIVVDALAHLTGPDADTWRDLFLVEHASLLRGAKAPDAEFKDFKNHVLHVGGDKEWGGARGAATEWYDRAVDALKARKWVAGAYALGVLSHYYADPLQPFHTGQTEEEGILHGALEWSLFKSRPVLKQRMESRPAATVHAGTDSGFVSDMVRAGAGASFPHYQTFIDHYDIHAGKKRPEDGPDDVLLDAAADLLNHAIRGVALLMSRAIEDAGVKPKTVSTSLPTFMARLDIPVRKMLKKIDDAGARREIEAAYKEFEATGKVIKALSDDDAEIRALHAKQVAGRDLKDLDAQAPQPTGRKFEGRFAPAIDDTPATAPEPVEELAPLEETPADFKDSETPLVAVNDEPAEIETPAATEPVEPVDSSLRDSDLNEPPDPTQPVRSHAPQTSSDAGSNGITVTSHIIAAPSIGKKTAARLTRVGVFTIGDLLEADADALAEEIGQRHIPADVIRDWQDQTRLKLALPHLRVHDVQILVGAGVRNVPDLAAASARELLNAALEFAETPGALRIIKPEHAPTSDEVDEWIEAGRSAA